jgi:iron(III) transport system substrate-binding protein
MESRRDFTVHLRHDMFPSGVIEGSEPTGVAMFRKIRVSLLAAAALLVLVFVLSVSPSPAEELVLYTSVKEPLIGMLVQTFQSINPSVTIRYHVDGSLKSAERILAEHAAGLPVPDVIWSSALHNFYTMGELHLFERHVSPHAPEIVNFLPGAEEFFSATRFVTMPIVYNTELVKDPPQEWSDIFSPELQGAFCIADPSESGTAFAAVSLLVNRFGWDFMDQMGKNAGQVCIDAGNAVGKTARGEIKACLAPDYIARNSIKKGAPLALAYPPEMLIVPTPLAILKDSRNMEAAKQLADFILSREAQKIIAAEGSMPARMDVDPPEEYGLPRLQEAFSRAILGDYLDFAEHRDETLAKFAAVMGGRNYAGNDSPQKH